MHAKYDSNIYAGKSMLFTYLPLGSTAGVYLPLGSDHGNYLK